MGTFSTNPGILKTIELDTRQVTNPGTTDYWVANSRQGQFQSRYSSNLGRINTLRYGSKLLYTNPVLTDTGSMATSFASAALNMVTSAGGQITSLTVGDFKTGAKLYVNGCPVTSADTAITVNKHQVTIATTNDCWYDAFDPVTGIVVYRRTDDPNNQNVYATTADVAKELAQGYCTKRGSADIYPCATITEEVLSFTDSTDTFTFGGDPTLVVDDTIFVNGLGPMKVTASATPAASCANSLDQEAGGDYFEEFTSDAANSLIPAFKVVATTDVAAGDILLMDGRRYKVAAVGATTGGTASGKVTLTETYAGGMILEDCSSCVTTSRTVSRVKGDGFMIEGYTNINLVFSSFSAATDVSLILSAGGKNGHPKVMYEFTSQTKALYKVLNGMGYKPYEITESVTGSTYQYVSQCANRGSCDSSSGICKCFKGYSNDNCDTQNMLAA